MTAIESTIRSLTKAQRRVLDHYAMGGIGNTFDKRTLAKLESLGLIIGQEIVERMGGGVEFRFIRYNMPIHAHIAWCNVGSAEFDALSDAEKAAMEGPDLSV